VAAEFYLVRHAEAAGHEDLDPGLSDRGRAQAQALGARLASVRPAGILHGPRRRAGETARILAETLPGAPVGSTPLLEDRTPVPSAGRQAEYPERFRDWLDGVPLDERDEDGAALTAALPSLGRLAEQRAGDGPLVLVTHSFVIGWFVRELLGAPTWRWLRLAPANASLTILRWDGGEPGALVSFNDTGHLA
jgi:serine/threonine-protein phosphatase PGAM5